MNAALNASSILKLEHNTSERIQMLLKCIFGIKTLQKKKIFKIFSVQIKKNIYSKASMLISVFSSRPQMRKPVIGPVALRLAQSVWCEAVAVLPGLP